LFREFLKGNFSEENLSFWIDVQDFKKKFATTSSANSGALGRMARASALGQVAMEQHNQSLIAAAFGIYNSYLAPSSHCELNIDHALRNELINYLTDVMTGLTGKTFTGYVDPELAKDVTATQLQHMIRVYERIQAHVFRLMATDSVPKVRADRYPGLQITHRIVVYENPQIPGVEDLDRRLGNK
jgi:GTPase-activating protein SST2